MSIDQNLPTTNVNDLEQLKFTLDSESNVVVRSALTGAFSAPPTADYIAVTYPDTTTEVFTYKSGGVSGTTLSTITIVYTDSSKAALSSVARA